MHLGFINIRSEYFLTGEKLVAEEKETDVGVQITSNLKPSAHCQRASQTAHQVLSQVTRSFHFRDRTTFVKIYKLYVRPHVEFATPSWSPWLEADIETIERVQKRFTKMVSGLSGKTYQERLKELGLLSLKSRRMYFDLIETFKLIHGLTNVQYTQWFTLVGDTVRRETRGATCPLNIVPKRPRLEVRAHFFSNRVAAQWNDLPDEMKSLSLYMFKNELKIMLLESESSED